MDCGGSVGEIGGNGEILIEGGCGVGICWGIWGGEVWVRELYGLV